MQIFYINKYYLMMNEEDNNFLSDNSKYDREKSIESNDFVNKQKFSLNFSNKIDNYFPIYTNILNMEEQNISLEEIKQIMAAKIIHLEEDDPEEIYFTKNYKADLQTTDTSTKNTSFLEKKEGDFSKIINFTAVLRKKRGRKSKNSKNKKLHGSDDFDNIQRKIQVHFISFLIMLANDALKSIFGEKTKFHFKHVDYDLKKIVNHNYIEYLKSCSYSDIMKMKISPKNKKFEENANKKTFLEVCKYSNILKNIFSKKYLYIFQKYYCCLTRNKNEIDLEGLKLTLSPKTKALFNLLKKNEKNQQKFNDIIKDVYFSEVNYIYDKKFVISPSSVPKTTRDGN